MIPLTVAELARVLGARTLGADERAVAVDGRLVTDVMTDSRVPAAGPAVFFALRTDRADGHAFVAAAAAAGALVAVVDERAASSTHRAVDATPTLLAVEDVWAALGRLARHVVAQVGCRVVAITGSYGKTTVKDLAAAALGCDRRVVASHASFNNELGVPLTMLAVTPDIDVLVAEAGARNAGDLRLLGGLLRPDVAIVSAVGPVHLETFGDLEGVAEEKAQLVASLGEGGTAVLNADDRRVVTMTRGAHRVVTVSAEGAPADVRAQEVTIDAMGRVRAAVRTPWGDARIALPMPGAHHLTNALLALAAAGIEGVDVTDAAAAIAEARTSPSRAALHHVAGVTVLDDAYNASPPTVLGALRTLADLPCEGRRWAVLGVMAELGPTAHAQHVAVGRACREAVDELVVVGDAAAGLAEGAADGIGAPKVHRVTDHAEAAALVVAAVRPGDTVLFKASRVATLDLAAAAVLDGLGVREGVRA